MRRILPALLLTLLLGGALATALTVLMRLVQSDRAALVDQFKRDRRVQLDRAASGVAQSLEDVEEDVRFAAQLLGQGAPLATRKAELEALLAAVGKYKAIAVLGADGEEVFNLRDTRFAAPLQPYLPAIQETAWVALRRPAGSVASSSSLEADPTGWFRVFATAIDDERGISIGVVAVLVDTAPLMTSLRGLSNEETWLLVLGANGAPLAQTDTSLVHAVEKLPSAAAATGGLTRIVSEMRSGREGQASLLAEEATLLGLPAAELIVVYAPLRGHDGLTWSIATFSSTDALRSRDRSLVKSLVLVSAVLAGFFALLGVSLTMALRRAHELAETRRHATELGHARDVIQKILDHVPTGLMALSGDLTVSSVNRALRSRVDPARPRMTLADFFTTAAPLQLARVTELVQQSRREGRVKSLFVESLFGAEGSFQLISVPLGQPDEELASLLVVDDLSAIRTLEEQLVRAEKLSTVGVLAAGIAHEIGTPLGIVRGRAEYIAGKLGGESPHRAGLTSIIEQIDRVSRVIRQLLDFSRLQPANTMHVKLQGAFESVAQLLDVEAERRGLVLEIQPPGALVVKADADQLQQVLINLILNGFDASGPGKSVQLSAVPVGGNVELVVRDTGNGMSEDEQRRIFDPFWTTKKPGQGTGLGLAMVAQLVRNHGGHIHVSSTPSLGTTVRVAWPLEGKPEVLS